MSKGKPTAHTIANEKWQKKAGYKAKTYKLKADLVEQFQEACQEAGVSQAAKITELMEGFIAEQSIKK